MRNHSDYTEPRDVHMRVSWINEDGRQGDPDQNPYYPWVAQDPITKKDVQFPEENGLTVPQEYSILNSLGKLTATLSEVFRLPL